MIWFGEDTNIKGGSRAKSVARSGEFQVGRTAVRELRTDEAALSLGVNERLAGFGSGTACRRGYLAPKGGVHGRCSHISR